jgi:hypothetical protein
MISLQMLDSKGLSDFIHCLISSPWFLILALAKLIKDELYLLMLATSVYPVVLAVPAVVLVGLTVGIFSFMCSTTIQRTAVANANPFSCAYFSTSVVAHCGSLIRLVLYSIVIYNIFGV